MSRENVELWRSSIEEIKVAASERDWEAWLTRAAELWDPEIEWDASEFPVPDIGGVYRGREGVIRWWREWLAAWGRLEFEYELRDAGERIVLLVDQRMRGRSSGIEVPTGRYAFVAKFRDGLMIHVKLYMRQTDALEAAGLRE